MTTWDAVTADYISSLVAGGRAATTIRVHRHYLRRLQQFSSSPLTLTIVKLEKALARRDWKPETRKSAQSVFKMFCRWMHRRGLISVDPSLMLHPVRVPEGVPRPTPTKVVDALLRTTYGRERWLVQLAAHGGLRCAEIAKVSTRDLDGDILYVTGKGGKTRIVPLTDGDLIEAISVADGWLFEGKTDGHLSAGHVSVLLSRLMPGDWTGHTLRHRMATNSYAGTHDLLAVGKVLGHSRPETTQRYVRVPMNDLYAVVRAARAA